MAFVLIGPDQLRLQRHVIGEQGVGNNALALAEVLARVPGLDRRFRRREFLTIDTAIQDIGIERVQGKDGKVGNEVADPVAAVPERRQPNMLPVCFLQDVVGDVASFGHSGIAVAHGPSDDRRHQAVLVGDLFRVARLQGRQGRQEAASPIHEVENIGDALCRQLVVEAVLQDVFLLVGLGFAPFQGLVLRVIVEMLELALAQFAVEVSATVDPDQRTGHRVRLRQGGSAMGYRGSSVSRPVDPLPPVRR